MRPDPAPTTGLDLYTRTAAAAAGQVIGQYSTSFALACRTLPRRTRADIASIYALVRVADEVVDGTARAAGLDPTPVRAALDDLEAEVDRAVPRASPRTWWCMPSQTWPGATGSAPS